MSETPIRQFGEVVSELQRAAADRPAETAQHIQSIQAQIEAIERGDFESIFWGAHEDVTLEIFAPPQFPFVANARGKPEFLAAVTHNFGAVVEQHPQIRDIFAEGDTVILFGCERGQVRDTGTGYDVQFVERFTFSHGRLTSVRIVIADTAR